MSYPPAAETRTSECMHGKGQKQTLFLNLHIARKMHEFAPRHVHIHTDTQTQTQTQTYTQTHTRTHASTNTHIHTPIHTDAGTHALGDSKEF